MAFSLYLRASNYLSMIDLHKEQTTDLELRMWCVAQVRGTDGSIDFEKIEKLYDFVSRGLVRQGE